MENTTFRGLQPDIFFSQPWFKDFADSYAKTLDDVIRYPIWQVENIRSIDVAAQDSVVAKQTLMQYGFNFPDDIIRHNYKNLISSIPFITLYGERSGTEDTAKLMSAILGRKIDITPLYTENYEDFYAKPHGPLQVEGGNWYKTTHVDLSMQVIPSDVNLEIPRGKTMRDRFLSAFYDMAPWSIVLNQFTFQYVTRSELRIGGAVGKYPKRFLYVGDTIARLTAIRLDGPVQVTESTSHEYTPIGIFSAGNRVFERKIGGVIRSSRTGITSIRGNNVQFLSVNRNTDLVLTVEHKGQSASLAVTVLDTDSSEVSLEIVGPSQVTAQSRHQYGVTLTKNGQPLNADVYITSTSVDAVIKNNELQVYELQEDQYIYLTARYQDKIAVKEVLASYVPVETVTDFRIVTVDEIDENSSARCYAVAKFDGVEREVLADWTTSSSSLFVHDGTLTSGETDATITVDVIARLQHLGDVYTAEKAVKVVAEDIDIIKLDIVGDYRVVSGQKYKYAAVATLTDGRQAVVTADWETTKYDMTGDTLTVGIVGKDAVNFSIRADVLGITATKDIIAVEKPLTLQSISVEGPDNNHEGTPTVFKCYAHYSNGAKTAIQAEWRTRHVYDWATIDQNGVFTVTKPKEGIVEIVATYRTGGNVFTKGRPVVVVPKTRIIKNLVITGPTSVEEGERVSFNATAMYSDGSTRSVNPLWDVRSTDPLNEPEVMAYVVSPGVVQGRFVNEPTPVIVTARYFQEVAELEIMVEPRPRLSPDVPESSRIIGPSIVDAEFGGSFVHAIVFEACPEEAFVSSDWSLDVSKDVAVISSAGQLRSVDGKSTIVTITSTYECAGRMVVDSVVVQILGKENKIERMEIVGPSVIMGKLPVNYYSKLFYTDGNEKRVSPLWSIKPADGRVTVDQQGNVVVFDNSVSFDFLLIAEHEEDGEKLKATHSIVVQQGARPMYGQGPIGLRSDEELTLYLTKELDFSTTQLIQIDTAMGEYAYLMYPVSMGLVQFRDTASDLIGAWDGASWPDDGDIGTELGPIVIKRNIDGVMEDWYLYRTDFDGLGEFEFEITFGV